MLLISRLALSHDDIVDLVKNLGAYHMDGVNLAHRAVMESVAVDDYLRRGNGADPLPPCDGHIACAAMFALLRTARVAWHYNPIGLVTHAVEYTSRMHEDGGARRFREVATWVANSHVRPPPVPMNRTAASEAFVARFDELAARIAKHEAQ